MEAKTGVGALLVIGAVTVGIGVMQSKAQSVGYDVVLRNSNGMNFRLVDVKGIRTNLGQLQVCRNGAWYNSTLNLADYVDFTGNTDTVKMAGEPISDFDLSK